MTETAQDRRVVLVVIMLIGAITLLALAGVVALLWRDKPTTAIAIPAGFVGTGLGALSAMLVSTRSAPPAPVAPEPNP